MADVAPLKRDGDAYADVDDASDSIVVSSVKGAQSARSIWADGAANVIEVGGGTRVSVGTGTSLNLRGGAAGSGNSAGGGAFVSGGNGIGNGAGGSCGLEAGGSGAGGTGLGGDVFVRGGGTNGSGNPGRVFLYSGVTEYPLTAAGAAGPALVTTAQTVIEAINENSGIAKGTVPVVNNTGAAIEEGSLVARSSTVGSSVLFDVEKADATDIDLLVSNVFGVVVDGDIADTASGTARLVGAMSVRFKAGLTLAPGEDVFMSEVPGEATNETPMDAVVGTGGSVQRLGVVLHALTYDGTTDRLASVAFFVGQRREAV